MDPLEVRRRARELVVERVAFKAEQDFLPELQRKCEWCSGKGNSPPITTEDGVFLKDGGRCDYCVGTGRRLNKVERARAIEDLAWAKGALRKYNRVVDGS